MADIITLIWGLKWLIAIGAIFIWWSFSENEEKDYMALMLVILCLLYAGYYYEFRNIFLWGSFLIFAPVLFSVFKWLKSKNSKYIFESRIDGDKLNIEQGHRLIQMPLETYEEFSHLGKEDRQFYDNEGGIVFCDLILPDEKLIFHQDTPETENITFFAKKYTFLGLKRAYPELLRRLSVLEFNMEGLSMEKAVSLNKYALSKYPLVSRINTSLEETEKAQEEYVEHFKNKILGRAEKDLTKEPEPATLGQNDDLAGAEPVE